MIKKIIHIDMDYFFAQIEIRDNPQLQNKYVIISADYDERNVVSTCSYNARDKGIHSGMATSEARKICPKGIFITPNIKKYTKVSKEIYKIFSQYSDIIETHSLDEAYLDVTFNKIGKRSAGEIAEKIQNQIYNDLKLTCSCGVSYNKFLAKIGSDYKKPHGITIINPCESKEFIDKLDIKQFRGIGRKGLQKCYANAIYTGKDLFNLSKENSILLFGKLGLTLYDNVRGIDNSDVVSNRKVQSIGYERTLVKDIYEKREMLLELRKIAKRTEERLRKKQKCTRTITLKVKYDDFTKVTKSKTLNYFILNNNDIYDISKSLINKINIGDKKIRLLGISGSKLGEIEIIKKQVIFIQIPLKLDL